MKTKKQVKQDTRQVPVILPTGTNNGWEADGKINGDLGVEKENSGSTKNDAWHVS